MYIIWFRGGICVINFMKVEKFSLLNARFATNSYLLSKQLEPDDLPSSLYVPEPSLSSLSPARIRRALRHVFNSKGNIVSDLSPPMHRSTRKCSLSDRDILSTINRDGVSETDGETRTTHVTNTLDINDTKIERSMSSSPEMVRGRDRNNSAPEISLGHIVRIATAEHDHCNYKCVLVSV